MEIIEIDYGMAYRINDNIYLNKNLKKYPKLYKAILKHEKEHSDGFEFKDIMIDLKGKHLKEVKFDYYMFFIRHPKSLIHFLPVFRLENVWTFDFIMLLVWVLFLILFALIWSIIN